MTIELPAMLESALAERARQRQVPVADLLQQAVSWYLQLDEELIDELEAWQEVRDEALELAEGKAP